MDDDSSNVCLEDLLTNMASNNPPSVRVTMQSEMLRVASFCNYLPDSSPYRLRLAAAGLYYTPTAGTVKCYCCEFSKEDWTPNDIPSEVHRKAYPNCDFFVRNSEVNIPVPHPQEEHPSRYSFLEEAELKAPQVMETTQQSVSSIKEQTQSLEGVSFPNSDMAHGAKMDISMKTGRMAVKHPKYVREEDRISTFSFWPRRQYQDPEQMARAGFFYIGSGDCVRCFYCGIGLKRWEQHEDPWAEHARWSPGCLYLIQIKRKEFTDAQKGPKRCTEENPAREERAVAAGDNTPYKRNAHNERVSIAVESVLEMGYNQQIVEEALDSIQGVEDDVNAAALLKVVMDLDLCELSSEGGNQSLGTTHSIGISDINDKDAHKKAVLDETVSVALQSVVEMGYDRKTVEEALDILQCDKGENITAVALLQMVMYICESISGEENQADEDRDSLTTKDLSNSVCDEDEKQNLEENCKCQICIDRRVSVVFLPCGHLVSCERCAYSVRTCPVCKSRVKGFERSVTKNRSL